MNLLKKAIHNPVLVLVIAIPLFAVVSGTTVFILSLIYQGDEVQDDWYKSGKIVMQDYQQEEFAKNINLSADVTIEDGRVNIRLSPPLSTDKLLLSIKHPAYKKFDNIIELTPVVNGIYRGELSQELTIKQYNIILKDVAGTWKITQDKTSINKADNTNIQFTLNAS